MDHSVHTDGSGFVSGGYSASTERRTEQGNQCVPVSVGCKFPVVDVLLSVWMVSFLVCVVGALVGIDSDYFSTILPHRKTGGVSADSVPLVGDFCRVKKHVNMEFGNTIYIENITSVKLYQNCSARRTVTSRQVNRLCR